MRAREHLTITAICIAFVATMAQAALPAMVEIVCLGADGHVHLERSPHSCCAPSEHTTQQQPVSGLGPAHGCGPCTDILLSSPARRPGKAWSIATTMQWTATDTCDPACASPTAAVGMRTAQSLSFPTLQGNRSTVLLL